MYTVFNREPFTPWKIVIIDRGVPDKSMEEVIIHGKNCFNYMEFSCVYRTTNHSGKECEQFTMMPIEEDYALLQLQIFKNGDINSFAVMPAEILVSRKEKRIEIRPLVYCEVDKETGDFTFKPDLEIMSNTIKLERNLNI